MYESRTCAVYVREWDVAGLCKSMNCKSKSYGSSSSPYNLHKSSAAAAAVAAFRFKKKETESHTRALHTHFYFNPLRVNQTVAHIFTPNVHRNPFSSLSLFFAGTRLFRVVGCLSFSHLFFSFFSAVFRQTRAKWYWHPHSN